MGRAARRFGIAAGPGDARSGTPRCVGPSGARSDPRTALPVAGRDRPARRDQPRGREVGHFVRGAIAEPSDGWRGGGPAAERDETGARRQGRRGRGEVRYVPREQPARNGLPALPEGGMAYRDGQHRGRLSSPRTRPHGHHRCPLVDRRCRGGAQGPRLDEVRRLGRVLPLPRTQGACPQLFPCQGRRITWTEKSRTQRGRRWLEKTSPPPRSPRSSGARNAKQCADRSERSATSTIPST